MGRALGALAGAGFFVWIAGMRALDPAEIGWLMRFDWPVHFFGWHFFRAEPWQWPPGLIRSYSYPMGTAVGFTDSIPLAAFALKPLHAALPATFQYIGPWLLASFALQGLFGAWLMAQWTTRIWAQVAAAAIFVMMPVLLIRIGHPSLCAHWLLLWVLVVAAREGPSRVRRVEWAVIGGLGGLLHPYLAVMALGLLGGVLFSARDVRWGRRAAAGGGALAATVTGWWASGLFGVSGPGSMMTEGLGYYSMNLLGPVTPAGWSGVLPDLPRATPGQDFEGFQYLGLGGLLLLIVGAGLALGGVGRDRDVPVARTGWSGYGWPLVAAAVAMAVFALSPRVTLGDATLVDATGPWTERLAVFRATGRFFWPLAYLLVASSLASIAVRLPSRVALGLLLTVVVTQAVDLHGAHEERRRGARDPGFYEWADPMRTPAWSRVFEEYDHLVLYPPPQCGPAPMPWEPAAYHAGLHGLTLNTGGAARPDESARLAYCHDLGEQLKAGRLADDSLYVVLPSELDAVRAAAGAAAACGWLQDVPVCVTTATYERWRDSAPLH